MTLDHKALITAADSLCTTDSVEPVIQACVVHAREVYLALINSEPLPLHGNEGIQVMSVVIAANAVRDGTGTDPVLEEIDLGEYRQVADHLFEYFGIDTDTIQMAIAF